MALELELFILVGMAKGGFHDCRHGLEAVKVQAFDEILGIKYHGSSIGDSAACWHAQTGGHAKPDRRILLVRPGIEQLHRQPCTVFGIARYEYQFMHRRGGSTQAIDGRQEAPSIAKQPAPLISDLHRQHSSREEKRQVRFEPVNQHLASLRVRRTFHPCTNLAQGQCAQEEQAGRDYD